MRTTESFCDGRRQQADAFFEYHDFAVGANAHFCEHQAEAIDPQVPARRSSCVVSITSKRLSRAERTLSSSGPLRVQPGTVSGPRVAGQ